MDFDFAKAGQNEKSAKGTVRRKIQVLPDMMTLMKSDVQVEEGFRKNRVVCSLATADGNCTLGFSESKKARPKSLIKGNELKNPGTVDLILRKQLEVYSLMKLLLEIQQCLSSSEKKLRILCQQSCLKM